MKQLFFLLVCVMTVGSSKAQSGGPILTWEKSTHDFGDVVQGEKVEHTFKFKNTGNEPLIITNVQVTCGCTIPKGWARDPIKPGQSGEITISFDSSGRHGRNNKVVTVVSNAKNQEGTQILFIANVVEKNSPH
ncbi:MAG TPA: DUF1573 domain-containing protein [Cyclobacteriaceae bacterium]|nr:DUF1573 domain-containing protein [Cyclobacteriaceae bacterium]